MVQSSFGMQVVSERTKGARDDQILFIILNALVFFLNYKVYPFVPNCEPENIWNSKAVSLCESIAIGNR